MPKTILTPSMQRERNISAALKKALIDKQWTVSHLAELLGMKQGNLSKVLNHPMSVKFDTICRVATKLGVTQLEIK